MTASNGTSALHLQARTFVATTAAQGLSELAARISLNPRYSAAVTTTTKDRGGLGQTTLAVFRDAPQTGYRDELFVCVIYTYAIDGNVSVDVLLRPGIVDGQRHEMASGPLRIPGIEDWHWSELAAKHVQAYAETAFRAVLAPPKHPALPAIGYRLSAIGYRRFGPTATEPSPRP